MTDALGTAFKVNEYADQCLREIEACSGMSLRTIVQVRNNLMDSKNMIEHTLLVLDELALQKLAWSRRPNYEDVVNINWDKLQKRLEK